MQTTETSGGKTACKRDETWLFDNLDLETAQREPAMHDHGSSSVSQ
jgi:hypothetical protein